MSKWAVALISCVSAEAAKEKDRRPGVAISGERDILSVRLSAVIDGGSGWTRFFKVLQASQLRAFC